MQDQYVSLSAAWFTLSLVNAGLAQSKGRSGLNWWLASIFIGPLATLLIVASPPGEPGAEPRPGTMDRRQAVLIGAGILLFAAIIAGLFAASGR